MNTNIINIHGRYVVKTGKTLVYENLNAEVVCDEEGNSYVNDEFLFSEEVIDVCTGVHYGFDGILHLVGNPVDSYVSAINKENEPKRGRHSRSNNKKAARYLAYVASLNEGPPF